MKTISILFAALLSLPFATVSRGADPTPAGYYLRVTILMFSGRRDPYFVVSEPKEIAELTAMLNGLPLNAAPDKEPVRPNPKGSGYVGLRIDGMSPGAEGHELVSSVFIHGRAVEVSNRKPEGGMGSPEFRFDGNGALEERLLNEAAARWVIHPLVLEKIRQGR
jgi:hypothetical protein